MRFWFSLSLFVFSLAYFIYGLNTLNFYTSSGRPGPGYFPALVAVGLIISTGINVAKDISVIRRFRTSFFSVSALSGASGVSSDLLSDEVSCFEEKTQSHNYPKDVLTIVVLVAVLIMTLTQLGGLLSMVLFMLVLLSIMNRGQWIQNIAYSLLLPLFLYLLFDVWLNASLPIGIFGI